MTTKTAETDKFEHARENAKGWLASIEEMLEKLSGYQAAAEAAGWTGPHKDKFGATYFRAENDEGTVSTWSCASWKDLCEAMEIEAEQSDEAREEIQESVLSVMVRDGWRQPGQVMEDGPEEYEILLTTGGPALRITGELERHGYPATAELQMQDWFLPWTRYPAPEATLLAFANCFWFGE